MRITKLIAALLVFFSCNVLAGDWTIQAYGRDSNSKKTVRAKGQKGKVYTEKKHVPHITLLLVNDKNVLVDKITFTKKNGATDIDNYWERGSLKYTPSSFFTSKGAHSAPEYRKAKGKEKYIKEAWKRIKNHYDHADKHKYDVWVHNSWTVAKGAMTIASVVIGIVALTI